MFLFLYGWGIGADLFFWVVEFAVLTLDEKTGKPKAKIYKPKEIDALLEKEGLAKKDEDTAMST